MGVRFDRTHCEWSKTRKLTADDVREIRAEYASGVRKKDRPHERRGITWKCYYEAATYRRWRRLED